MKKTFIMVLVNAAALACATAQVPPPIAKEGGVDISVCWGGQLHMLTPAPNELFGTYVVTGGTRAADGVFDSMSLECLGAVENRAGEYRHKGYCTFQSPGGDKVYGTDATTAQGYTWQFLGGTGKFQGISGSGNVERLGNLTPIRQGTVQGCRRLVGRYRLP